MRKVFSRLLVFFIGVPVVLAIIFTDVLNHLPLHMLVTGIVILGASELYEMFRKKTPLLPKPFIITASALLPVATCFYAVLPECFNITFPFGIEVITYIFIAIVLFTLFIEVFFTESFEHSLLKTASSVFIILYVAFMMTFVSRLTMFRIADKNVSTAFLAVFVMMVFLCDRLAWFFGVLFGKSTRGFAKASPNKSLVGFAGGILGSILAGVLGKIYWNDIFTGSILKIIFLGIAISISSIVGDLAESVFKRSAEIKDSGSIMPGRGGILDSIDSIIMSAPLFYFMTNILYGPFVQ